MTYKLIYRKKALKKLKKLDKLIREKIIKALEKIRFRPYNFAIKLVGYPNYKLKVGDYRVIINIDNKKSQINILDLGHRRNIYQILIS